MTEFDHAFFSSFSWWRSVSGRQIGRDSAPANHSSEPHLPSPRAGYDFRGEFVAILSPTADQSRFLDDLPGDVLLLVASFAILTWEDVANFSMTCRSFYHVLMVETDPNARELLPSATLTRLHQNLQEKTLALWMRSDRTQPGIGRFFAEKELLSRVVDQLPYHESTFEDMICDLAQIEERRQILLKNQVGFSGLLRGIGWVGLMFLLFLVSFSSSPVETRTDADNLFCRAIGVCWLVIGILAVSFYVLRELRMKPVLLEARESLRKLVDQFGCVPGGFLFEQLLVHVGGGAVLMFLGELRNSSVVWTDARFLIVVGWFEIVGPVWKPPSIENPFLRSGKIRHRLRNCLRWPSSWKRGLISLSILVLFLGLPWFLEEMSMTQSALCIVVALGWGFSLSKGSSSLSFRTLIPFILALLLRWDLLFRNSILNKAPIEVITYFCNLLILSPCVALERRIPCSDILGVCCLSVTVIAFFCLAMALSPGAILTDSGWINNLG